MSIAGLLILTLGAVALSATVRGEPFATVAREWFGRASGTAQRTVEGVGQGFGPPTPSTTDPLDDGPTGGRSGTGAVAQ